VSLYSLHNPGAPIELRFGGLELTAFSISGLATYVLARGLDACFDLGHCPIEATRVRNVFLTHVHQDHSAGAFRHYSVRAMYRSPASRIFLPRESHEAFTELFRAWERVEEKPAADLSGVLIPLAPGQDVRLSGRHTVRVFDVVHRIASRGYTVVESRRKLRPEYAGLAGAELGAARARGERVHDVLEVPVFTYVGDSTIATLRAHPELGQSEVLFLEATHVGDTDPAVSERYGHTHLDELVALYRARPETLASPHVVIKHFSTRYERDTLREAYDALPDGLRERVTFLMR
jgi:ribonuclease Z